MKPKASEKSLKMKVRVMEPPSPASNQPSRSFSDLAIASLPSFSLAMLASCAISKCNRHHSAGSMSAKPIRSILFVCLGNICRSPLAEGVLRAVLAERGLDQDILLDSAGTSDWEAGSGPDP